MVWSLAAMPSPVEDLQMSICQQLYLQHSQPRLTLTAVLASAHEPAPKSLPADAAVIACGLSAVGLLMLW